MKNSSTITIGIVGNINRKTDEYFYLLITKELGRLGYTKMDHGYPRVVLYTDSKSIETGDDKELIQYLEKAMDFFIKIKATFIAAPCNTLMFYKGHLEKYIKENNNGKPIPILDIMQITADTTDRLLPYTRKVGLISTKATADKDLYDKAFRPYNKIVVKLDKKHQGSAVKVLEGIRRGGHLVMNGLTF